MKKMGKDAEQRILRAVEQVTGLVDAGESPNAAIVKTARDLQLPHGHVTLVSHAYNIGRTTAQRQGSDDTLEKSADFEIADPGLILAELFPGATKAAAAPRTVSEEYSQTPLWYARKQAATQQQARLAAVTAVEKSAGCRPLPTEPQLHLKQAYRTAQNLQRDLEESRRQANALQDRLLAGMAKIAEYFQRPGSLAFADVRTNTETLFGTAGVNVLRQVERFHPRLAKSASRDPFHAVHATQEPYCDIAAMAAISHEWLDKVAAYEAHAEAVDAKTASLLEPHLPQDASLLAGLVPREKSAGPMATAMSATMLRDLMGTIGSSLKPPDRDSLVQNQLSSIASPEHEQQLSNIRTQSMLNELLTDDEFSKAYSPLQVANIYNDMSQIAPRAAQQPMLMRSVLRKHLTAGQGNIDPFEVDQLVGTENRLRTLNDGKPQSYDQPS